MVQDDEAAVYHRDKRLDAIWWLCADEFVTESTVIAIDPIVAVGPWVDLYPCRPERTLGQLAPQPGAADRSSIRITRGMHEGRWDHRLS